MGPLKRGARVGGWLGAAGRALLIVALLAALFAYVPDRLAQRLDRRGWSADTRDLVLLAWFTLTVVVLPAILVRVQRRRML